MKKSMFFLRFLSLEKILLEMLKCFFSSLVETLDANISEFLNFVEKDLIFEELHPLQQSIVVTLKSAA